jgi:hypothetical protein
LPLHVPSPPCDATATTARQKVDHIASSEQAGEEESTIQTDVDLSESEMGTPRPRDLAAIRAPSATPHPKANRHQRGGKSTKTRKNVTFDPQAEHRQNPLSKMEKQADVLGGYNQSISSAFQLALKSEGDPEMMDLVKTFIRTHKKARGAAYQRHKMESSLKE